MNSKPPSPLIKRFNTGTDDASYEKQLTLFLEKQNKLKLVEDFPLFVSRQDLVRHLAR